MQYSFPQNTDRGENTVTARDGAKAAAPSGGVNERTPRKN